VSSFGKRYAKIAYGKPKDIKGAGKVINVGSYVGTRIVQYVYFRPEAAGYRLATGQRRRK